MGFISAALMSCGLFGCAGLGPLERPSGTVAEIETGIWREEILRRGQDGDWLVIRGYRSADQLVAIAGNAELTHVGILDAHRATVIEAVSPEVREIPLQTFLNKADRILLVRPEIPQGPASSSEAGSLAVSRQLTASAGSTAVERARSQVGAPYDTLGTIGLPEPDKFYCSELAAWSAGHEIDFEGIKNILHPAEMAQFGRILFDSESRTRE